MQRIPHRCPRCGQPLGISWDMWGKYYLCSGCGFTAEDDDELNGTTRHATSPPLTGFFQKESQPLRHAAYKG